MMIRLIIVRRLYQCKSSISISISESDVLRTASHRAAIDSIIEECFFLTVHCVLKYTPFLYLFVLQYRCFCNA